MGSSAKSIASQKSKDSMNSKQSVKVRAARVAKMRIEGVIEKKMRLASMLNRRAFLRRFGSSKSMEATLDSMEMELNEFEKAIGRDILGPPENDDGNKKPTFSFDFAGGNGKTTYEMETPDALSEQGESQEVRRRREQPSSIVNRRLIVFSNLLLSDDEYSVEVKSNDRFHVTWRQKCYYQEDFQCDIRPSRGFQSGI